MTSTSVTLVNKDQLDILASLRESVNEDKAELEADLKKIKDQLKDANDKNKMQIEQINTLLLEKVNLQGDSIDVREKMLARERDFRYVHGTCLHEGSDSDCRFSDLKRVIAGKDLPEDVKSQLVNLHEEVGMLKEQYKESQDKLNKAKAVCANLYRVLFRSLIAFPVHQISRQVVQRGTCEEGWRSQRGTLIPDFLPERVVLYVPHRACTRSPKLGSRSSRKKANDLRFVSHPNASLPTSDENFPSRDSS